MDNKQVVQLVFDHNHFRIGELIWLAACNDGMVVPDALRELIEDGDGIEQAFGELPGYIDDKYDVEQVAGWLLDERKLGFLARVDTPTPQSVHENGFSTLGWGMYSTHWVYGETTDELLDKAVKVSREYVDRRCAELRKKVETWKD